MRLDLPQHARRVRETIEDPNPTLVWEAPGCGAEDMCNKEKNNANERKSSKLRTRNACRDCDQVGMITRKHVVWGYNRTLL